MTDADVRLAVTTSSETFERVQAPFAERGVEVVHVDPTERVTSLDDPRFPNVDVGWVYPTRLMEGAVLDASLDIPWVNDRNAVLTSRNKAGVLATLGRANVPVPESVLVSNPADDDAVLAAAESLGYPLVVKPNSTTRGVGVTKVSDPDSLLGTTDYLDLLHDYGATGDKSYLLQEFLPNAHDYRVMVVDGAYAGAVERRLPQEGTNARPEENPEAETETAPETDRWKHNVHRGAEATGVSASSEHRRLAERAAAALDIPLLGVDLLESDGRLVVSETNARPTVDAETKYETGFYDALTELVRRTADRG